MQSLLLPLSQRNANSNAKQQYSIWQNGAMKKLLDDLTGLAWTLAGTGLVLITLTGSTRKIGLLIGVTGLLINLGALAAKAGSSGDDE